MSEKGIKEVDLCYEGPNGLSMHALHLYHKVGSLIQVSRELGIPMYQLKMLGKQPWWEEELQLLRQSDRSALDVTLTRILDSTLAELTDRLANGEKEINKAGVVVRKPLSASVITRVMEAVFDKRQLIRSEPTHISSEHGKLAELAGKLEEIARQRQERTIEGTGNETKTQRRLSSTGAVGSVKVRAPTAPMAPIAPLPSKVKVNSPGMGRWIADNRSFHLRSNGHHVFPAPDTQSIEGGEDDGQTCQGDE